ncbi:MAG: hypothetical protein AAF202_03770 [Pseudomonadota bacterium]
MKALGMLAMAMALLLFAPTAFAMSCKGEMAKKRITEFLEENLAQPGNPDGMTVAPQIWKPFAEGIGLEDQEFLLAVHAAAENLAKPPISGYHVSNFILTHQDEIVFGVNMEFGDLRHTIHGEQFAFYRSLFREGGPKALYVDGGVCGHCRQVMAEGEMGVNLGFHTNAGPGTLGDYLPDAFHPQILGAEGVNNLTTQRFVVSPVFYPNAISAETLSDGSFHAVNSRAALAATLSWAPYSKSPNGTALYMKDGEVIEGVYLENVNFNASTPSFMGALIEATARGYSLEDIQMAVYAELAPAENRAVYRDAFLSLFQRFAPNAVIDIYTLTGATEI